MRMNLLIQLLIHGAAPQDHDQTHHGFARRQTAHYSDDCPYRQTGTMINPRRKENCQRYRKQHRCDQQSALLLRGKIPIIALPALFFFVDRLIDDSLFFRLFLVHVANCFLFAGAFPQPAHFSRQVFSYLVLLVHSWDVSDISVRTPPGPCGLLFSILQDKCAVGRILILH